MTTVEDRQALTGVQAMADPVPLAFGLFAFTLVVFGIRFVAVTGTTITGPTSDALNVAILVAGIGQTIGGVLSLLRGVAFTGWVASLFGVWLIGFYLLSVHTDAAAAHDPGILAAGPGGAPLPAAVQSALQSANVAAWHAESLAWYVLALLIPVLIFAIQPFRDRNIAFMIAFGAVIVVIATLGLGLHEAYGAVTSVTRGTAKAPDLGAAVGLLRASAWAAFVAAVGIFWIFVKHVYPSTASAH